MTGTTPGIPTGFVVNDHAALTFSKDGPGVLYYGALLRYAPAELPTKELDRGIVVQRWFEPYVGGGQSTTFYAGDLVRVRVRIATSQARNTSMPVECTSGVWQRGQKPSSVPVQSTANWSKPQLGQPMTAPAASLLRHSTADFSQRLAQPSVRHRTYLASGRSHNPMLLRPSHGVARPTAPLARLPLPMV